MPVDYSLLHKAIKIRDAIIENIYTQSVKGKFRTGYINLSSYGTFDESDIESDIVQDYLSSYFNSNGYLYRYDRDRFKFDIVWEQIRAEGECGRYFDISMQAIDMKNDFIKFMLEEIDKAVHSKSTEWEVIIDYDFISRQPDTAFWLANEVKWYCDEHDNFFDCEIIEKYNELVLVFTDSKGQ